MSSEIYLSIAGLEHMTKQPPGLRYALFCNDVLTRVHDLVCETISRGGHLGSYPTYAEAREVGLGHPHSVLIKFYPDFENRKPVADFINEMRNLRDKQVSY
jgi:hypothetical protein